ncbi:WcaI family glycosyltransferase [Cryomorpha ignava]|uniref:WcaI family glycosyltransferase n=1 Tax=Cryomorpha ignava TaxID=101383 RepID=A0A7K3WKT7_9FLAO|nr:WcaI family glycosyltransferase [Cryomorpha ignava]NEN22249.1 WcaI family glycosyltransferase [Cryomorpha ignava]
MRKRVLLLGYNFFPEPTGIGKYSGEMIEWLANSGCECTVLTTYPYYPYWKVQEPYRKNRFWYKIEKQNFDSGGSIKIIRCPIYVPSNPSGLKRIVLDFTFLFTSAFPLVYLLFKKKKDLVMAVAPSFLIGLPAVLYKFFKRSKFIYHIQDMQIEAARDLGMIKSKFLIKTLFGIENFIFRKADIISSISDGMTLKLRHKSNREIYFFPNWADIKTFHPIHNKTEIKKEYGFEDKDEIVLYSGAIGQKQGLDAILSAADFLREEADIKFIICGQGPYKSALEKTASELKLNNTFFFPLQPLEKFNDFLNLADVHLVIQKADASDLMMPSKLTSILAVGGLALITANENSGLHSIVKNHGVGMVVPAENQEALNLSIRMALREKEKNRLIREKARSYAEQFLDKNEIMSRFKGDML